MATASSSSTLKTYHCLCSHLLIATTHDIPHLPQRSGESLDRAYVLPTPPIPERISSAILSETHRPASPSMDDEATGSMSTANGVTVLLSMPLVSQPALIRRSDGIEKRYVLQCSRCKLPMGYHLDWAHWEEQGGAAGRKGRREDLLYLLPGALLDTEQMMSGKKLSDVELGFGLQAG